MLVLGVSGPVLGFNEPARVSLRYEVLEPGEWAGKELPILEHIDIGDRLKAGNWLVLLYHYDCPGCAEAIPNVRVQARRECHIRGGSISRKNFPKNSKIISGANGYF